MQKATRNEREWTGLQAMEGCHVSRLHGPAPRQGPGHAAGWVRLGVTVKIHRRLQGWIKEGEIVKLGGNAWKGNDLYGSTIP